MASQRISKTTSSALNSAGQMGLAALIALTTSGACHRSNASSSGASPAASSSAAPMPSSAAQSTPTPKETSPTPLSRIGILEKGTGLEPGQHVPDVHARDLQGKEVKLSELVPRGPLLLAFYRGGWCPYCNFEIRELSKAYPEYRKFGVLPVAVSVDQLDEAAKTNAAYRIPFPVLSDTELSFVSGFHVENHLDDAMVAQLRSLGIDPERYSGKAHHTIAIPALFLIDKQGVVRWAHDDSDITVRPSTDQILFAIGAINMNSD